MATSPIKAKIIIKSESTAGRETMVTKKADCSDTSHKDNQELDHLENEAIELFNLALLNVQIRSAASAKPIVTSRWKQLKKLKAKQWKESDLN